MKCDFDPNHPNVSNLEGWTHMFTKYAARLLFPCYAYSFAAIKSVYFLFTLFFLLILVHFSYSLFAEAHNFTFLLWGSHPYVTS